MDGVAAIHVVAGSHDVNPERLALVAATLTLMTAFAFDGPDDDRGASATVIADSLQDLAAREELPQEFRRICGRLHGIWAAAAQTA